jgi:uncharacterized protein (DUF1501 family)
MLTFFNGGKGRYCDGLSRRGFLKAGALAVGGLTLADLLKLRAEAAPTAGAGRRRPKSVIMICLGGGPSHLDTYDMKPDAPAEYRGEFRPIRSNVPGMDLCELLPQQAKIADKFSVVRSATWVEPDHQRMEVFTGFPKKTRRPSFGSVVSRLGTGAESMPKFVSLQGDNGEIAEAENPLWVGARHRPFVPKDEGLRSLEVSKSVDLSRLRDRKALLDSLDTIRRDVDAAGQMGAMDAYAAQALDMISSGKARRALDITEEPDRVLEPYRAGGTKFRYYRNEAFWDWQAFVRARRLVEAGVPFVSMQVGLWDHHCDATSGSIFEGYRTLLPLYDQCLTALIRDLHERGLSDDVCVMAWGEFGRTPKVNAAGGRDHWPGAGCVLFSGGGLKMGQYAGATDARGEAPTTRAYGPQNFLATLYHVLGIDPGQTLPDFSGRPQYLLDERDGIAELV